MERLGVQRADLGVLVLRVVKAVQLLPLAVGNVQLGGVQRLQRRRGLRGGRRRREGEFNLLVTARDGSRGGGRGDGGRLEGGGALHVPDEVDELPLVVDALLRRHSLLLFPLLVEVGEDEGTGGAAGDHHQSHHADQQHVDAHAAVSLVGHCAWTLGTHAGLLEGDALVTIATIQAATYDLAIAALTRRPLLAGIRVAEIQRNLAEVSRISNRTIACKCLHFVVDTLSSMKTGGAITRTWGDLAVLSRITGQTQTSGP